MRNRKEVRRRRTSALLLGVVLSLAMVAIAGRSASANTETTVKIKVGQTVKLTLNDLSGDDANGFALFEAGSDTSGATPPGQTASGCDGPSNPSCDDIPITLDVPKSELTANNNLFLQAVFTYDTGPQVTAPNGSFQDTNQVTGWLWENPIPTTGPNANTYAETCGNEPCEEGVASPTVATFNLIIDQETGDAGPVSVVINLFDVASGATPAGGDNASGSGPPAPTGGATSTPASSGGGSVSGSASPSGLPGQGPSPTSAASTTGTTTPHFALDTDGADPLLASLANTDFASELGIGAGRALRTGAFIGAPAARPASGLAVALSLIVGPVLLAGLVGFMAFRRRGTTL